MSVAPGPPLPYGQVISGLEQPRRTERRSCRRYALPLELEYKVSLDHATFGSSGVGNVVNISSGGVWFRTGRVLPLGSTVRLSIKWPMLLDNCHPLKLSMQGRVVRSDHHGTAIMLGHYEFRTGGSRSS
jgi:PilZ domain